MSLKEDFIGQNIEKQSWLSTNFFFRYQSILMDYEKNAKKIKKKPGTDPVPGLKVFFRVKILVMLQRWKNY